MVKLPFWATSGGIPTAPGIDEEAATALLANAVRAAGSRETALELLDAADPSPWLWLLLDRWEFRGASQSVMERLFAWFASDDDVMRLGEMLTTTGRWGPQSPIPPRIRGIEVLSQVDSDYARLELLEIQRTTPRDDLWATVRDFRQRDCDERAITMLNWSDLAAPDFGFRNGRRRLEFARPEVDASCEPDLCYREVERGTMHARLSDSPVKPPLISGEDREVWSLVEARVGHVLRNARHRLARAMVTGQGWPLDVWRRAWCVHGLLAPMSRCVVWIGDGERQVVFLPTGEGDFIDERMDEVVLDGVQRVRPAHPLELDLEKWSEVLATHEVVQPIDQLVRLENLGNLDVLETLLLRGDRLVAAEAWGWRRRASKLGNSRDILELNARDFTVSVYLSRGIGVSKTGRPARFQPNQRVTRVVVKRGDDEVAREEWPTTARAELSILLRRAAL